MTEEEIIDYTIKEIYNNPVGYDFCLIFLKIYPTIQLTEKKGTT
jgi:hypothetical protein